MKPRAPWWLVALLVLALPAPAAAAGEPPVERAALRALQERDLYIQPEVADLVDAARLRYATAAASRAADGAEIKLAFVDVPDPRLSGLLERLYGQLGLRRRDALVVATQVSIIMRSDTLVQMQEQSTSPARASRSSRRRVATPKRSASCSSTSAW